MKRRGFLGAMLAACVAPAYVRASSLMPGHALWLPPAEIILPRATNSLLTIEMITREALRILEDNLTFTENVNREYVDAFAVPSGQTIAIRRPARFTASA